MKQSRKPRSEFLLLQDKWYQRLKKEGFRDVEVRDHTDTAVLKSWDSFRFQARFTPESFEDVSTYYYRAYQFLHCYEFSNTVDEITWKLHVNGCPIRDIAFHLKNEHKVRTNKDYVRAIIKRLQCVMKGQETNEEE